MAKHRVKHIIKKSGVLVFIKVKEKKVLLEVWIEIVERNFLVILQGMCCNNTSL